MLLPCQLSCSLHFTAIVISQYLVLCLRPTILHFVPLRSTLSLYLSNITFSTVSFTLHLPIPSNNDIPDKFFLTSPWYVSIPRSLVFQLCNAFSQHILISSYQFVPISCSSLFSTFPYHLSVVSITFSARYSHIFTSLFHNVAEQFSFISSYRAFTSSQSCFPHLLRNVYYATL